jgi:hypothetical protein
LPARCAVQIQKSVYAAGFAPVYAPDWL